MTQKTDELNRITEGFGFRAVQTCAHLLTVLNREGIEIPDFIAFVQGKVLEVKLNIYEGRKRKQEAAVHHRYNARRCPRCGSIMSLLSVNSTPRDQIGGTAKSCWYCTDKMGCGFEIYSDAGAFEEAEAFRNIQPEVSQKRKRNAMKRRK